MRDPQHAIDLLALEPTGDGFQGRCIGGTPHRVFGGHTVAQALVAGARAIDERRPLNSFHAYFLAPGRAGADVTYRPATVKSGRAIDIVAVGASQDRDILISHLSFLADEESETYQNRMPAVPAPESLASSDYAPPGTRPEVRAPFDLRYVDDRLESPDASREPRIDIWIRTRHALGTAPGIAHQALLAYAVDFLITRPSHLPLDPRTPSVGASLDYAMWFHRPFRVDEWLLASCTGATYAGSRSLSMCSVFDRDGGLVATGSQEALLRQESEQHG